MKNEDWKQKLYSDEFLRIIAEEPHKLGWFIGLDKLLPLHSDWIRYCWDSDEPRALQAFRGGYKTTAMGVVGTIRWMLFHPNDRVAIIRKNFNAAAEVTRTIALAMETPELKEVFRYAHGRTPKLVAQRDGRYQWSFKETRSPEGNLSPLGIETAITGSHFDKILCDDIITLKDRNSRAERDHTKEIVHEIAANIIDPGKGSMWIGTPWHQEDAWVDINKFCDVVKYPLSKYNFLGEKDTERKRLMTTPYLYAANYELELQADESLLFQDPVYSPGWDFAVRSALAQLDAAYDGDHYCALTIAAPIRKGTDGQHYQITGFTYPGNVKNWISTVVALCKKYRVQYIYTEDNPDKGYTADKLSANGLRVKRYSENQNKHLKISTYLFDAWPRLEWALETDDEYMNQVTDYREGSEPDDAPDSAASLFREGFTRLSSSVRSKYEW